MKILHLKAVALWRHFLVSFFLEEIFFFCPQRYAKCRLWRHLAKCRALMAIALIFQYACSCVSK